MSDGTEVRAGWSPMGKCLTVFAGALVAAGAGSVALAWAWPQLPVPGLLGALILPLAAIAAGKGFVRQAGRGPTGAETASFAIAALMLAVAFAFAVVWGVLAWQGLPMTYPGFAAAFIRSPAAAAEFERLFAFWLEMAPWLALILLWVGFGQGARGGAMKTTAAKPR